MIRTLFLFLMLAVVPHQVCRADVFETFDYPVQFDSTGFGGDTYRITETGNYGMSGDLVVTTFSEGLADGAGIEMEATNRYAHLSVALGSGFSSGENVLLGIADIPGFGDQAPGGVFGSFFSPVQNLTNAAGSVDIRQVTAGPTGAVARFIAVDANDFEVYTSTFGLTSGTFTEYQFTSADFDGGDPSFDPTQVIGIGVEFFALADGSGNTNEFDFHVDNLSVSIVPEPTGTIFVFATLLWGLSARRRRIKRT